ncbi:MAG: hypothetical protein IIA75_04380, partial [Proteobacteria bacterium]|nr:hypothetical protein [Pseudomonadota bacterium]
MKFHEFNSDQAVDSLRALVMIAKVADNSMARPQRALLDAIQRCLLPTDLNIDDLEIITASELTKRFPDPLVSRQVIQQMILVSLADGPPNNAQSDLISDFAAELQVTEPAV